MAMSLHQPKHDVPLRCTCGHVRAIAKGISPSTGLRFLCYCEDCQSFARFLNRTDVTDAAGGTDIFQMPLGYLKLIAGADALQCVRLTKNGAYRWYTGCCQTPIGNTFGPRVPMIGVIHNFMDFGAEGCLRDGALGPPLCRIFERSAKAPIPPNAPPAPSFRLSIRRISKLLIWWMRGLARPSPFFDAMTGVPACEPRVLTPSERSIL